MVNRQIHIGIDCDGVLRNFASQFTKYAEDVRGVAVRPEDYSTWGFSNVRDREGRKVIVDVFANPAVGKYVYEEAPPIENAYTGFRMFVEHPKIMVYIVSSQKKGYEQFTDRWLQIHGFDKGIQGVFYERKKTNAPVQILIDDKPTHVVDFNKDKRDSILMNAPYNLNVDFGVPIPRVDNMIEAFRYVKRRYGKYL